MAGGSPLRGGEPQDGAGAFLNAIPMRDDMRMETWAMRLSVQRRLGLPLDVACQAAAAGKKTRNGKTHDEYGDAAVNVPQQGHNTRHKYTLRRLILALRARGAPLCEWRFCRFRQHGV